MEWACRLIPLSIAIFAISFIGWRLRMLQLSWVRNDSWGSTVTVASVVIPVFLVYLWLADYVLWGIVSNVRDDYDKGVSKALEAGFRADLLDRSVSLSGAVFHTDLEDRQFFNFFAGPFGLLRVVTNIDDVQITGFELNARWRATDWLTLFAGYGYVDGEIEEYRGRPYTEGNAVPYAPEYTGNLGAEVSFPISNYLTLTGRLDGSFVGETWFHPVQDDSVFTLFGAPGDYSLTSRDSYSIYNFRLGVQADKWGVTGWVLNFTDEDYLAENITAPEFGGSFIHDSPGRSYGIDVNFKF